MPKRVDVLIYRQGLPVQRGWTRDLSMEGAFVETGGLSSRRYEMLDLEFLPGGCNGERFRLQGMVVHLNGSGLGFEFGDLSETANAALRKCLCSGPPADYRPDASSVAGVA